MAEPVRIYFTLEGALTGDALWRALAERHGLTDGGAGQLQNVAFRLTDLGTRDPDPYHPYMIEAADMASAAGFFDLELRHTLAIAILAHPDRYDPRSDVMLSYDAGLVEESRSAGFAAVVPNPADVGAFYALLGGAPGAFDAAQSEMEDEMFGGAETESQMRAIAPDLILPGAAPFPVVLGRSAWVAGWAGPGQPMQPLDIIDRLAALMGAQAYRIEVQEDEVVAASHEAEGFAIEFSIVPGAAVPGLPHPGPFVQFEQYFDSLSETDTPIEETVPDGCRRLAEALGFCAALEVPYDASAGTLVGFVKQDGALRPLDLPYDAEAEDG